MLTNRKGVSGLELSERKKKILRAVIENYIESAEPVGSKVVAELAGLDVSSATIRNEMSDLEEMGYLEQPHTSAGRVPSAAGYRLYVNELMSDYELSMQETARINAALKTKMRELDRVIDEAGRIVASLTQYPAFALTTGADRLTIRRYDLLMVDKNAFIAVVMTDNDVVRNRLFRMADDLTQAQLQMLGALLNSSFTGLTVDKMPGELSRVARNTGEDAYQLISKVAEFGIEVLEEIERQNVHLAGIANLLDHREFRSLDRAQPIMNFLSSGQDVLGPFPAAEDGRPTILIGPENVVEILKDTSVIMARCEIGEGMQGFIGVLGPTRMDYSRLSARLTYFARSLSRALNPGAFPPEKKKQ